MTEAGWKTATHRYDTGEELHFEYRVACEGPNGEAIVTEVRGLHLHGNWQPLDGTPEDYVVRSILGKPLRLDTLKPAP